MVDMSHMERAVAIVNANRRCNNPHSDGLRVVGFIVDEELAGLSPALFALDEIVRTVNAHEELLVGLREIARHLGHGALVSAATVVEDLLAKHGGAQ